MGRSSNLRLSRPSRSKSPRNPDPAALSDQDSERQPCSPTTILTSPDDFEPESSSKSSLNTLKPVLLEDREADDVYLTNMFSSSSMFHALPEVSLCRTHSDRKIILDNSNAKVDEVVNCAEGDIIHEELHRAVYRNDIGLMLQIINDDTSALNRRDHRGNTPILLAVMRGNAGMAKYLVDMGAQLDVTSEDGQFCLLDEVIALGDEQLLLAVYSRLQRQAWQTWKGRVPNMLDALELMPDFYLEMHWKFGCDNMLAPLVNAIAPSDTYKVWKQGSSLRVDSTIAGYTRGLRVLRGNVSLILQGRGAICPGTILKVDHGKRKVYNVLRRLEYPTIGELQNACRKLLRDSNNGKHLKSYDLSAKTVAFGPARNTGWGAFRTKNNTHEYTADIEGWTCKKYEGVGSIKMDTFTKSGAQGGQLKDVPEHVYFGPVRDLFEKNATWGQSKVKKGHKEMVKSLCASMWMSNEFPLSLGNILPIFQVLAIEDKSMQQIIDLLQADGVRDAGFPVQLSLPLYLGVYASVTFSNCVTPSQRAEEGLFSLPKNYGWSRRAQQAEEQVESNEQDDLGPPAEPLKKSIWSSSGALSGPRIGCKLSSYASCSL